MRKVSALFLAMLMCMALAVPALASGGGVGSGDVLSSGDDGTVTYKAKVQEPTIEITVPSLSRAIILNPYQIRVTTGTASGDIAQSVTSGDAKAWQNSLLSTRLYLHNKSTVPLHMSLELLGTSKSTDVTFATGPIAATEKNKKVFMFVQVGSVTEGSAPTTAELSTATYDNSNPATQGIFKAAVTKMTNNNTSGLDIPTPRDPATGNYVPIDIGGECTTTPTNAWASTDTIEATITFSFQAYNNTVSGT